MPKPSRLAAESMAICRDNNGVPEGNSRTWTRRSDRLAEVPGDQLFSSIRKNQKYPDFNIMVAPFAVNDCSKHSVLRKRAFLQNWGACALNYCDLSKKRIDSTMLHNICLGFCIQQIHVARHFSAHPFDHKTKSPFSNVHVFSDIVSNVCSVKSCVIWLPSINVISKRWRIFVFLNFPSSFVFWKSWRFFVTDKRLVESALAINITQKRSVIVTLVIFRIEWWCFVFDDHVMAMVKKVKAKLVSTSPEVFFFIGMVDHNWINMRISKERSASGSKVKRCFVSWENTTRTSLWLKH